MSDSRAHSTDGFRATVTHTSHAGEFHTDLGTFIAHCTTLVAFIDLSRPVYSLSRSSVYNSPSRSLSFLSSPFTLPPSIHPVLLLPALLSRCPAMSSSRLLVQLVPASPLPTLCPLLRPPFPSSILLFPLSPSTPNSFINSTDDWASLCSCHGDARGGTNHALWDGGGGWGQELTTWQPAPPQRQERRGTGARNGTPVRPGPLHKAPPRGQAPERTPRP